MKKFETTYEHRGVLFTYRNDLIDFAAEKYGIDLIKQVERSIDDMIDHSTSPPKEISVTLSGESTPTKVIRSVIITKVA